MLKWTLSCQWLTNVIGLCSPCEGRIECRAHYIIASLMCSVMDHWFASNCKPAKLTLEWKRECNPCTWLVNTSYMWSFLKRCLNCDCNGNGFCFPVVSLKRKFCFNLKASPHLFFTPLGTGNSFLLCSEKQVMVAKHQNPIKEGFFKICNSHTR